MDADFKKRQLVNFEQMNGLLEFLQEHQFLAKGLTRGRRGKLHSMKLWNLCAKKLNPIKDGAMKNGRGWSKYWVDWKYRVRRKALVLKAAKDNNRPPPDGIVPMSDMEERILGLIGENAVNGVVIRSDPLADGDSEEVQDSEGLQYSEDGDVDIPENNDDTTSVNQYYETRSKSVKVRKRRLSIEASELEDRGGPSSPPERKPRVNVSRNGDMNDSDRDDDASRFLRLEKQNLENSTRILESVQTIALEITRLVDVMADIRDVLVNRSVI